MQLAGHGKDPRCLQVELSIVPKKEKSLPEQVFKVGDRVTHANELIRNGIKADFGRVVGKRFDRRKKITWLTVSWDDGTICKGHVEGSGTLKVIESQSLKVGDRIKDKDGFIGEIIFVSDRCINVKGQNSVKSYNLNESKDFQFSVEILPVETDFAVSISGEAIFYDPNAKPVELKGSGLRIAENRELYDLLNPICDWYCAKPLPTFAINALAHALEFAREGKITEAVELLNTEVMAEIKKPTAEVRKLKEFLANFVPSIDAGKLPVFAEPIAPESTKSVANLRMDESKVSVLVEVGKPFLVESDRLAFLTEQREKLIASGASPKGVWLNIGKVPKRDFVQVVWKSDKPHPWLGGAKSRYIGKFDSDEHKSAVTQHKAGQELRRIDREIKKLEKNL